MQTATLASTARAAPGWFAAIPAWLEALAVAGAIALVLPAFTPVADFGAGRDRRFTEAGFRIEGLPSPLLPALCRDPAVAAAEAVVRDRLCPGVAPVPVRGEGGRAVAHVVADDDGPRRRVLRAEQAGQRRSDVTHDRVVELLADDAAHVVGLHDAGQVGHGRGPYRVALSR